MNLGENGATRRCLSRYAQVLLMVGLLGGLGGTPLLGAGSEVPRPARGSNAPPTGIRPTRPALATNAAAAKRTVAVRTNAPAGKAGAATNAPAGGGFAKKVAQGLDTLRNLPNQRWFVPAVLVLAGCLGLVLVLRNLKRGKAKQAAPAGTTAISSRTLRKSAGKVHSCNILQTAADGRRVWQFDARGSGFVLGREQHSFPGDSLPPGMVAKDWRSLFQEKLNVAWLPPEQVFLRVVQLPRSDLAETASMVELQMEKLSPIPVVQAVWSLQVLPHREGHLQTVIVMIAARAAVEEFLGQLENQGFMADRLELPLLDQLQATPVHADGAYIYPEGAGGRNSALVAWWYGGVLQNLDLVSMPGRERGAALKEQLLQMAWAGEMDGWVTGVPQWHLVAEGATATEWEAALREGLEQPVETLAPLPAAELAARTAVRTAQTEPLTNLLPPEFATRYRQQFVDRIWMRSLGALVGVYLAGVFVYFIALGFLSYKTTDVEDKVAALSQTYTNSLQLRARYQVLKDRQELKFAALDCWNAVARLPEGVTLESFSFMDGKRLVLAGTTSSEQVKPLMEFEDSLRKAEANGQPLFKVQGGEPLNTRANAAVVTWQFGEELKRSDLQ